MSFCNTRKGFRYEFFSAKENCSRKCCTRKKRYDRLKVGPPPLLVVDDNINLNAKPKGLTQENEQGVAERKRKTGFPGRRMAGEESRIESCLIAIGSASSLIRFRRVRRRELVDYRIDISPNHGIHHPPTTLPHLSRIFPYSVSTLN